MQLLLNSIRFWSQQKTELFLYQIYLWGKIILFLLFCLKNFDCNLSTIFINLISFKFSFALLAGQQQTFILKWAAVNIIPQKNRGVLDWIFHRVDFVAWFFYSWNWHDFKWLWLNLLINRTSCLFYFFELSLLSSNREMWVVFICYKLIVFEVRSSIQNNWLIISGFQNVMLFINWRNFIFLKFISVYFIIWAVLVLKRLFILR